MKRNYKMKSSYLLSLLKQRGFFYLSLIIGFAILFFFVSLDGLKESNMENNSEEHSKLDCKELHPKTNIEQISCGPRTISGSPFNIGFSVGKIAHRFREFEVFINSILEFRTCPLNLHIIGDIEAKEYIENFFSFLTPHDLRTLTLRFANIEAVSFQNNDWKVPEVYSFTLGKISVEQFFPDLQEIVMFDFDQIVIGDICSMIQKGWSLMDEVSFFGMTFDQPVEFIPGGQFHYLAFNHNKTQDEWYGPNAGTLFMNLTLLKEHNWRDMWRNVVSLEIKYHPDLVQLPEQNIINYIAKRNNLTPTFLRLLPIEMNYALHKPLNGRYNSFENLLLENINTVTILHGNSMMFAEPNWWSREIWWLFATPNLTQYYRNMRPDKYLNRTEFLCIQRSKVRSTILYYLEYEKGLEDHPH